MERPTSFSAEIAVPGQIEPSAEPVLSRRRLLGTAMVASVAGGVPLVAGSIVHAAPGIEVNAADETIRLGPLTVRFLVTSEHSLGSVSAFEVLVPRGQKLAAPAHSHDHYEETVYGVSGVLTWTVNGKQFDVGPGQALCIPRGAVHRFDNNGATDVQALCVVTPAAIGPAYFREAAAVIKEAAGGPPDPAKMIAVMKRHGITPVRP